MIFTSSPSRSDEKMLIQMAFNGDLDAFNQLVLNYQNLAYSQAYSLLDDPALAEDATQESFIKAFRNIRHFLGGSFKTWLMRIVINTALDMLRWSKRHPTQPLFPRDKYDEEIEPRWLADPTQSVETIVELHELSKNIHQLLGELPEYYRVVITLVDMYALDYAEVAEVLELPIGTVKSRLARARRYMRGKLLGHGVKVNVMRSARRVKSYQSFADQDFVVAL